MKKIKLNTILWGMAMLIATACSSEMKEEPNIGNTEKGNFLQLDIEKACETRYSSDDTHFSEGDEVLVILNLGYFDHNNDGEAQKEEVVFYHSKATYHDGGWVFENPIDLNKVYDKEYKNPSATWNYSNVDYVQVFYPYSGFDISKYNGVKGEFLVDNFNVLNDYMIGFSDSEVGVKNNVAKVRMKHVTSRITLKVHNPNDYDAYITQVNVSNVGSNFRTNGTGNERSPLQWFGNSVLYSLFLGYSDQSVCMLNHLPDNFLQAQTQPLNIQIKAGETVNIDLFVPPIGKNEFEVWEANKAYIKDFSGVRIKLEANGHEMAMDMPQYCWEIGKQYTYPVTIAGEKKQRDPNKIDMGYTKFIDGKEYKVYWSDINVGAYSEEDSGLLFGWGNPSPLVTTETLDFYPSANPPASIVGTQYDIAREYWGGNWRMPTNGDMWSLLSSCNEEWISLDNGVEGVRYTSKENGNTVFFPFTETRIGDNTTKKKECNYWLGELNKEDSALAGTFYIYWANDRLSDYPTAGKPRYYGLPVRGIWLEEL